jgi:hypothetical protein
MGRWPRDNQAELIRFYGNPGNGEVARQLVKVVPPFQMYYDGRPLKSISFHRKAAPALKAALDEIWENCKHDQALLDREGISNCAGTYNPRKVRGSATKWSNHAFGAAIDLDAKDNGLGTKGDMPYWVVNAFKRQGFRWGGDYRGRKDPMHFEACDPGPTVAVGIADLPEGDTDADDIPNSQPPPHDVAPDAPIAAPWYKKAWTWLTGGGFATLAGGIYDYRVAIVLGAIGLVVFLVIWFTYLRKRLERE